LGALLAVGTLTPTPASAQSTVADLSVTVSHSPSAPETGDEVTFTITATNAGPATAVDVAVGFAHSYYWRHTSSTEGCELNGEQTSVICPVGSIAAGSSTTVAITTVPLLSGVHVLPAVVASETADPDLDDRSDDAVILVARGPSLVQRVVAEVYRQVLGREGSAGEIAYWAGRVEDPFWLRSHEVPLAIISSPESARRRVAASYEQLLGRQASGTDLAYWADRLVGGMPFQTFEAHVMGSAEFARRHGPAADLVAGAVYQHVVGRGPSSAEVVAWTDSLEAGADVTGLAAWLRRTNEGRIEFLGSHMQEVLGREPHDFDRLVWYGRLNEGATLDELWADLFTHGEFLERFPYDYG